MHLAGLTEYLWLVPSLIAGIVIGLAVDRLLGHPPPPSPDPGWCVHQGCDHWLCRRHTREWDAERLPR